MVQKIQAPGWHKHNTVKHCFFYTDELGSIVCAVRGTDLGWRLIYRKDGKPQHEILKSDSLRGALIEATKQVDRVRGLLLQERMLMNQLDELARMH